MAVVKNVVKAAVGAVNRPIARRRFARALAASPGPWKIELGAHRTRRPGWIATDVSWRARHYLDATRRWPLPDASVSHVYADNVIEHLRMGPNRALLREARRVLVPGGRIRLATPDVEHLAGRYLDGGPEAEALLAAARGKRYEVHHPVDLLRVAFQECGHHLGYLWDFGALRDELVRAGFGNVRRFGPGCGDDPVLEGLEARAEFALVVEAEVVAAPNDQTVSPSSGDTVRAAG